MREPPGDEACPPPVACALNHGQVLGTVLLTLVLWATPACVSGTSGTAPGQGDTAVSDTQEMSDSVTQVVKEPGPGHEVDAIPAWVTGVAPEGYGAVSRGGEGGRLILVTSLEGAGPGSLREALESAGPRIIRFQVGGTIHLQKRITVRSGRVTVDGISAAGLGGITVAGGGIIFVECEDVIVRHVRLRGGYDPLSLIRSRRVLIDHVTAAWAMDENMDAWGSEDVTFQWSILAEGLVQGGHEKGPHSMGSLQGGGARRITTHHCLFTGNVDRNPLVYGPRPAAPGEASLPAGPWRFDVVNNLVYNYWNGAKTRLGAQVNFIGNHFLPGPQTAPQRAEILVAPSDPPATVYLHDNLGPNRGADDAQEALLWLPDAAAPHGFRRWSRDWAAAGGFPAQYLAETPFPAPRAARVRAEPAAQVRDSVLASAGAWPRDREDLRLVEEVRQGQGRIGRYGPGWRGVYERSQEPGVEVSGDNEE
jgi:hypothetical protein